VVFQKLANKAGDFNAKGSVIARFDWKGVLDAILGAKLNAVTRQWEAFRALQRARRKRRERIRVSQDRLVLH
jgi:hypothetical protein